MLKEKRRSSPRRRWGLFWRKGNILCQPNRKSRFEATKVMREPKKKRGGGFNNQKVRELGGVTGNFMGKKKARGNPAGSKGKKLTFLKKRDALFGGGMSVGPRTDGERSCQRNHKKEENTPQQGIWGTKTRNICRKKKKFRKNTTEEKREVGCKGFGGGVLSEKSGSCPSA